MVYIYVLKLQENKYYVGKTNNPSFRIENHLSGYGSSWTTIYKPLKLVELIPNCDDYDEDKYTQKYMDKYGVDNVRGGSFVSIELSKEEKKIIEKKINGSNDKCFKCGIKGHFASNCLSTQKNSYNTNVCYRCGRPGHYASSCYATTNTRGEYIDDSDDSEEWETTDYDEDDIVCYRCGRPGHYASCCYARTTINGSIIQ